MNLDTVTLWDTAQDVAEYERLCYEQYKEHGTSKYGSYSIVGHIDIPQDYDWDSLVDHNRSLARIKDEKDLKAAVARRYQAAGYTTDNADLHCISDENFPNIFQDFADNVGLTNWYYRIQVQRPGQMVPDHIDSMRSWSLKWPELAKQKTHKDVPRYLVLCSEPETGHFFTVGTEPVVWKRGDVITFDHRIPHATANAGFNNKVIALLEGC